MGNDNSALSQSADNTYEGFNGVPRLVFRDSDLTRSMMADIGIGGEDSTTAVDVARCADFSPPNTAFLAITRINLEDLRRTVMMCRNDDQLKTVLRDEYSLRPNCIVSCLRRGVATRNLPLLEHALKFNHLLPPDSSLKVDNGIILQLLQKAVTKDEMAAFQVLLQHARIPNTSATRTELLSMALLSAQYGNCQAVRTLCTLYPTCLSQTPQGRAVFVELSGAHVPDDLLTTTLSALLEIGANVNTQGPDGNTALHNAVANGYASAVQLLVRNGACVNLPNVQGHTPLSIDQRREVQCLGRTVPSQNGPAHEASLYLAAEKDDREAVDKLLKRGIPVNSMWLHGRTALSAAAGRGHVAMVNHLLSARAAPFPLGHVWPNFPVCCALKTGHTKVAVALMEGARWWHAQAKEAERKHIAKQLVLLLHHCAEGGAVAVAQFVLSPPFDVHPDVMLDKMAPLHVASRSGQLEMVKLLVSCGANPVIPSETYQNTPFHYACFYGHIHVAEYLLTLPAVTVNCTNAQMDTPLYCVLRRQLSLVEKSPFIKESSVIFLLHRGAILVSKEKHGCNLDQFSLKTAENYWAFIPENTQKLIVVVRDGMQPLSLMASARLAVRAGLEAEVTEDVVSKLGVPYRLQRYLLFKDRFPS